MFGLSSNFNNPTETRTLATTYFYPGYPGGGAWGGNNDDIALAYLANPITDVAPMALSDSTVQVGDTVTLVGYGAPGTPATGVGAQDGNKRAGESIVTSIGFPGFAGTNFITEGFLPAIGLAPSVANQIQLTGGDSGGATLVLSDTSNIYDPANAPLVALNDFALGNYAYSGELLVAPYKPWIEQTTTSVPEPGTLVMFAAGALILLSIYALRRRRSLLAGRARDLLRYALVSGMLFLCGSAQAVTIPDGANDANYVAAGQNPMFQSVGWVNQLNSGGSVIGGGRAVLIDPQWILLTGHELTDRSYAGLEFGLGSNFLTNPGETRSITATYLYPGYPGGGAWGGSLDDIALCYLNAPITDVAPAVLFSGPDQAGIHVSIAGYGARGRIAQGEGLRMELSGALKTLSIA